MGKKYNTNLDPVKEANANLHKAIEHYKSMASSYRNKKKYSQDYSWVIYNSLKNYFDGLVDNGKPITISGMILASGLTKDSWYEMRKGEHDHELFAYMDVHGIKEPEDYVDGIPHCRVGGKDVLLIPFSEIIEKALLMHENETETRLYEKGRVGDIFSLKAQHNWQEEEKRPQTVNQTLVIADSEQARRAIELLK